ncbi:MAG: hypothetical protein AAF612_06255 [Planctomycetota bacterium]
MVASPISSSTLASPRRGLGRFMPAVALGVAVTGSAFGQEALVTGAEEAAWSIRFDMARCVQSPLGQELLAHWEEEEDADADELFEGLLEASGLDLREDVGEVLLMGDGYDGEGLRVLAAELSDTPGQIEGWLLTMPGYESAELDDTTLIHSFLMMDDDDDYEDHDDPFADNHIPRVWAALPQAGADGPYFAVAATDPDQARAMAEAVRNGTSRLTADGLAEGVLIELNARNLHDLPMDADEMGSQVLASMRAVAITLANPDEETVNLSVRLTAQSPARGRQIAQLLRGLLALPQLAAVEDDEAQDLAEVAQRVTIGYEAGSNEVTASATAEPDELVWAMHLLHELDDDDDWDEEEDEQEWDEDDD